MANDDIITLAPSNYTTSNSGPQPRPHQNAGQILDHMDNIVAWKIFKFAGVLAAFLSFYWLVDEKNWYNLQIVLFFLTVVTVTALLLAVKLNMAIFGFGALFGRNKDQNFLAAGSDEVLAWITKGIPGILFGIMLFMAAFIVYPWSLNFFVYWLLLGVVLICFTMMYLYAWGGSWLPHITFIGCMLVAIYILLGSATGNVVLGNIPTLDHISVPSLPSLTTTPAAPVAPPIDELCKDQKTGQPFPFPCEARTFTTTATDIQVQPGICAVVMSTDVTNEKVMNALNKDSNHRAIKTVPGIASVRTALLYLQVGQSIQNFTCN